MGLTIHYQLAAAARNLKAARALVGALRKQAAVLPLQLVGQVLEAGATTIEAAGPDDPRCWLFTQATRFVWRAGRCYPVKPRYLIAFSTSPGAGCEEANFGLARYPPTIDVDGRRRRTGLAGWSWSSFCKTVYASRPAAGGIVNFLRCHTSVVGVLDAAAALGFEVDVCDEGDYWDRRDPDALAGQVAIPISSPPSALQCDGGRV